MSTAELYQKYYFGVITEDQLKDHLMKSQQELPTKADAIEKKILDKHNISFEDYFE